MIFQISIFALITCFYIAYFVKQILLRKKGIHTNRLAKGLKPPKTAAIETTLLAATYGIAVIQYVSVFFSRFMLSLSFSVSIRWTGIVITGGGVIFFVLAITSMRDSWRAGVDETQKTSIVTRGIYKVSRNPAFVGFDMLYIGSALSLPNVIMIAAAIIGILLLHFQILEEEKYLPRAFGDEYLRYKSSTPRYFLFF
ncbi:MAG: isoprenylcysteine carboxylmethyltransferase family protein [Hungatella sp.]|jgi:protein-S-isoprenylcysteine O-methyltransferase Ste14|nr:isoprenylcysteine carboxylmethyltransferase family protein [Hungatella sp.]